MPDLPTQKISRVKRFLRSATAQLAMTYLLIIMVMSVSFSVVLYNTSSRELGRQIPPDRFFNGATMTGPGSNSENENSSLPVNVNQFFKERAAEARQNLIHRLIGLNALVLVGGAAVSYYLARRSLRPIEANMEAQAQFVSDASHELRTPLTAIQTSNEVALRKQKLTIAEARQVIEQNTDDIARLKELSDGLLNLARQDRAVDIVMSEVALQDVTSDALNQVIELAQAKHMSVQDEVDNIRVLSDRPGLERVLVILLDNAIKYSDQGSAIYISTRQKGKSVYVDVRDEGIGIRASDLPHVFRRFYRADNSRTSVGAERHGYGLGLAIARQIMKAQGGDVGVVSTVGEGSTFTIRLTRL